MAKDSVVFLVPDTFGSHLEVGSGPYSRVWLNPSVLADGEIDRLAIADGTRTTVNAAFYRPLADKLEDTSEVVAFDYDWRRSARVAGSALGLQVRARLDSDPRPVHLVAHGAGGLAVLAMLADGDELPGRLYQRGSRLLLLGTSAAGSWEIVRMLAGQDMLSRHLATFAGEPVSSRFTAILRSCPGLLEQVPPEAFEEWGDDAPDGVALAEARDFRKWLGEFLQRMAASSDSGEPTLLERLLVVAGVGVATCASLAREGWTALYTAAGDGRVLAGQAMIPGATPAYVEASHAELIRSADVVSACVVQLNTGDWALRSSPPAFADAPAPAYEPKPPEKVTPVDLAEAAIGALARKTLLVFPLSVVVAHGHLREARHPLAVGHYRGDSLVSAEAVLDDMLDGALRQRFDAGTYPGAECTVEIVRKATSHPPGAIIIGIGDLSDLSPSLLRRAFGNALVRYALRVAEDWRPGQRWQTAAFSTLLVGTGGGGAVELAECIKAITGGAVDANRHLRKNRALWDRVRIDAVEFVEMFEDRAVQAARIVRELPDLMSQELRPSEQIRPESQLDARSGGEFLHDVSPYRGGWWRRVEVRRSESATDASAQPQPQLHFTTFTDRARVEDDWVVRDEAQLTRLVKAATQQPAADLKLSNAIYEMLVPGNVKNRIAQGDNLLLVVDAQAARYPFELLAQRVGEERRPLAIGRGLLRQLAFDGRAAAPVMGPNALATGRSMLVIGAPRNVQPPLTGASREAQIVADVAEARGYQPNRCIDSDSQTIQMELFAQDYRMLHVAAHGRFSPNPLASGVVIGDKEYLTVADVQSLAAVPEFVFLNACHLAKDVEPPALPFPELAAGVAVAFIRAGARAVIAAGWAVEDDAALIFAQGFYNRFLAGETFGEAVKAARQDVYAKHPDSNTWGAYQCYGNPDYRLPDPSRSSSSKHPSTPVSRSELVAMLRSLAARAGGARGQALRALAQDFSTIRDGVSARWKDGGVIAELAAVASELEDFAQASALYGDALKSAKALAPIRAVEQLVNVLGRQAPKVASDGTPEAIRAAVDLLETAKGWLDWLDKLGPSPERAALRGSLHKRWALVVAGEQRREHLRRAEAAYQDAHMRSRNESYQLLNWLALQFLNSDPADPSDLVQRTKSEWVRAMDEEQSKKEPDFWVRVAVPDALLHIRLFEGGLSNQDRAREVEEAYAAVLKMGPTARELASVTDHVVFLIKMLADLRPDRSPAARSALERVRRLLTR